MYFKNKILCQKCKNIYFSKRLKNTDRSSQNPEPECFSPEINFFLSCSDQICFSNYTIIILAKNLNPNIFFLEHSASKHFFRLKRKAPSPLKLNG